MVVTRTRKSEIAQTIAATPGLTLVASGKIGGGAFGFDGRFITKIRLGEMVAIEYVRPLDTENLEHVSVKIPADEISADLEIKLNQHRDALIDAIGLDESLWHTATITGTDFKWVGDQLQSYKLHGSTQLEWASPAVSATIPAEYADLVKVEDLCAEVILILDGKRSQLSLPLFDRPAEFAVE